MRRDPATALTPAGRPRARSLSAAAGFFLAATALFPGGVRAQDAAGSPRLAPARAVLLQRGDRPGEVREPARVFLAADGRLYVTDTRKAEVLWFDENFVWRGTLSAGTGRERLDQPIRAVADSRGRVYVAEGGARRVRVFDEGRIAGEIGGQGTAPGRFRSLDDLAVDPDDFLYVADADGGRVHVFTPDGLLERVLTGLGAAAFQRPALIAVDPARRIILYDRGRQVIYAGDPDAGLAWEFPTRDHFSGDRDVLDLDVDDRGVIYLLGRARIPVLVLSRDGQIVGRHFGQGSTGPEAFDRPVSLSTRRPGFLAVLDQDSRRVQEFALDHGATRPLAVARRWYVGAGHAPLGWQPVAVAPPSVTGPERAIGLAASSLAVGPTEGGAYTPAPLPGRLTEPLIAVGTADGFIVVDRDDALLRLDRDGRLMGRLDRRVGSTELRRPRALAWRSHDSALAVYDDRDQAVLVLGPDGAFRQRIGRRGSGPGELAAVVAMAFDAEGRLLVVDQRGARLQAFDRFGVMTSEAPTNTAGFSTPDGGLLDVGADGWGRVYLLQAGTGIVVAVDAEGRIVCRVGDPRVGDRPSGLAVTSDGVVLVRSDPRTAQAVALRCDGPPPRPRAPVIALESSDPVRIELTWGAVPGAARYDVVRPAAGGGWESIGSSTTTAHTLPEAAWGLTPGPLAIVAVDERGRAGEASTGVEDRLSPALRALREGRAAEAEPWLATALAGARTARGGPPQTLAPIVQALARAISARGEHDRALRLLDTEAPATGAGALDPTRVLVHREALAAAAAAGNGELALAWLERLATVAPAALSPTERRTLDLTRADQRPVAVALFTRHGRDDGLDGLDLTLALAEIWFQEGYVQLALAELIGAAPSADSSTRLRLEGHLFRLAARAVDLALERSGPAAREEVGDLLAPVSAFAATLEPGEHEAWELRLGGLRAKPRILAALALEGADFEGARELYREILATTPALAPDDELRVRSHLGALALAAGAEDEARAQFVRVLELRPGWDPDPEEFSPSVRQFVLAMRGIGGGSVR